MTANEQFSLRDAVLRNERERLLIALKEAKAECARAEQNVADAIERRDALAEEERSIAKKLSASELLLGLDPLRRIGFERDEASPKTYLEGVNAGL